MHGGATGSGAPEGERNGAYRHGRATRQALAAIDEMRTWLKIVRASLKDLE